MRLDQDGLDAARNTLRGGGRRAVTSSMPSISLVIEAYFEAAGFIEQDEQPATMATAPVTLGEAVASGPFFADGFEAERSRGQLNAIALEHGVKDPDKLQNKGLVVAAIRAAVLEQAPAEQPSVQAPAKGGRVRMVGPWVDA